MQCRSCGAELPPNARECPNCGALRLRIEELPPKRRHAVHGVIVALSAIVLVMAVAAWWLITTDRDTNERAKEAICDMRFNDAEAEMESVRLFQPGDKALREELVEAGKLSDAKRYVELLSKTAAIRAEYDDGTLSTYRGVLDQLEAAAAPALYIESSTAYNAGEYGAAYAGFETLSKRGYDRSGDYLFLTRAHLAKDLATLAAEAELTEDAAGRKLLGLIGFADTNKLLFTEDSYAALYLDGVWNSSDGSLVVTGTQAVASLPGITEADTCTIHEGVLSMNGTPAYTLAILNANTVMADRVEDGIACTLRKVMN